MSNKYIKNNGNGNFKVTVPFEINTYDKWSVETKIITGNTISNCILITTEETNGTNNGNFKLSLLDRHLVLALSYDGSNYTTTQSDFLLDINNTYIIKLEFTGDSYVVNVSTDGSTYTEYISVSSITKLYSDSAYVVFIPTIDNTFYNGELDIDSTKLISIQTNDNVDTEQVVFDGSETSSCGYLNKNITISNAGIASGFSVNNYLQCNGFELNDYIKLIMRISFNDVNTRQSILYNNSDSEIYVRAGKLGLKISNNEIQSTVNLNINTYYYIGYLCKKNNQTGNYEHSLYYMLDDSYYDSFDKLPEFNANCIKQWIPINTISSSENIFNKSLIIGSNGTQYLLGSIDLNNTILGNNIVSYTISKPKLLQTSNPNVRCYVPQVGTRAISQSSTINNITLTPMVKLTINAKDLNSDSNINLTNAVITYTVTNTNYNYYVRTTDPKTIYVISGSNVTYKITNLLGFSNGEKTLTNITEDTVDNIVLTSTYTGLKFTAEQANSTIGYTKEFGDKTIDLKYSYDGVNWTTLNEGETITLDAVDKYIFVKGFNPNGLNTGPNFTNIQNTLYHDDVINWFRFQMTGRIAASGNVNSLLDNGDGSSIEFIPCAWCYYGLFYQCESLTTPPELPVSYLGSQNTDEDEDIAVNAYCCYKLMFSRCTNLRYAPELPSTTVSMASYMMMFYSCTSLTQCPELPATDLYAACYFGMFENCTSITETPVFQAATSTYGYAEMFADCTALVTAHPLTSLDVYDSCYNLMFSGCRALVNAPDIYFNTTNQHSYACVGMFQNCVSLQYIKLVNYTGPINGNNNFSRWVYNVPTGGTIYYKGSTTTQGVSGIPQGWTVVNNF